MRDRYRTVLVVSIALMTAVGMGAVAVTAQETGTETETPTDAGATPADGETETPTEEGANETATDGMADAANVSFGNQSTNGSEVVVNSTTLPDGGYVVIYTVNTSVAENVTGDNETVTATENATEAGVNETETEGALNETETEAGLEANETDGVLDENETEGALNETETEAGLEANETDAGANESENDTEITSASSNVTSLGEVNNSTLGTVVGNSSYLAPGSYLNQTVEYNDQVRQTNDQVLIAVAYQDAEDNQTFDGAENESVYVENGTIVSDWAFVTVQNETGENLTETETPTEEGATETDDGLEETETEGVLDETETEMGADETDGALNETETETVAG